MAHKLGIYVCAGLTGSGKTTWLADRATWLLRDNKRTHVRRKLPLRRIASNVRFSPEIERRFQNGIVYWENPEELVDMRNVDVIWDELATALDSTQYQNTPLQLKRWLQQHRKMGVCIYGTVQDFPMLDISMRRLVHRLRYAIKIIGSRDISANMPNVKRPWGVIFLWEVKREDFTKDASEYRWAIWFPELLFISKSLTNVYDTTQMITGTRLPPLKMFPQRVEYYNRKNELVDWKDQYIKR
jgi:hypothetical protein